jgi:hypothetical protein
MPSKALHVTLTAKQRRRHEMHFTAAARAVVTIATALVCIAEANADPLLETAPQGTTNGGTSVYDMQFLGARFTLTDDYRVTSIGGHFKGEANTDRSLFLAVVALAEPLALPSLSDLSAPIFAATFIAPYNDAGPYPNQVPDTLVDVSLDLRAGSYALIAGSGLFGATGAGWMPTSGPIQPLPWYFAWNGNFPDSDFRDLDEQPVRFLVNGEPCSSFPGGGQTGGCFPGPGPFPASEPSTLALVASALLWTIRRRRTNIGSSVAWLRAAYSSARVRSGATRASYPSVCVTR